MRILDFYKDAQEELNLFFDVPDHPFKYVVLTSFGKHVQTRYVVLREAKPFHEFLFYTDFRSGKVTEITSNPEVQLLWYHPDKKLQIRVTGTARIHNQNSLANLHWANVHDGSRKSYSTHMAPGTPVSSPEDAFNWSEKHGQENFTVVEVKAHEVEILQLNRNGHLRARYEKANNWEGTWLVP